MDASMVSLKCDDFMEFQDMLKKMRFLDDKIVYALNTTIPTESFKAQINPQSTCKDLYDQLNSSYCSRDASIKRCINVAAAKIKELKDIKTKSPDDFQVTKKLKREQTMLRLLQAEINVEEVLKDRTLKTYYERCRTFYKPPDLSL